MARVTIGIPMHNEEAFIADTVQSALNQLKHCSDVDICISDNDSTDSSLPEVEKVLEANSSVQSAVTVLTTGVNQGATSNFWKVFDDTDSEYFMWLGAHDQISDNYIHDALFRLEQIPTIGMVCGGHQAINPDGSVVPKEIVYEFSQENPAERYLRSIAQLTNCYIFHSVFRRNALDGFVRMDGVPSYDHILISRWLWSGRLVQSPASHYLRRYFGPADRATKEGRGIYVSRTNNSLFYDAYLSDFQALIEDFPVTVREILLRKASDILLKRYGIPYLA